MQQEPQKMAKKTYFVTGTDTGVGKTIAAAAGGCQTAG
jgi:dethiobiotin synthetase